MYGQTAVTPRLKSKRSFLATTAEIPKRWQEQVSATKMEVQKNPAVGADQAGLENIEPNLFRLCNNKDKPPGEIGLDDKSWLRLWRSTDNRIANGM